MRRRNWLAASVIVAASLVVGVGMAVAATGAKATKLTCKLSLATMPPPGSNTVNQPAPQGFQYGPVHCPRTGFGGGIAGDSFKVPDSGDTVGTYTEYFKTGSITGSFDLTPQEAGSPSLTNFASATWLGTIKITGGTGAFNGIKGVKGKKGLGIMKCTSPDTVHFSCTEKIKLTST